MPWYYNFISHLIKRSIICNDFEICWIILFSIWQLMPLSMVSIDLPSSYVKAFVKKLNPRVEFVIRFPNATVLICNCLAISSLQIRKKHGKSDRNCKGLHWLQSVNANNRKTSIGITNNYIGIIISKSKRPRSWFKKGAKKKVLLWNVQTKIKNS